MPISTFDPDALNTSMTKVSRIRVYNNPKNDDPHVSFIQVNFLPFTVKSYSGTGPTAEAALKAAFDKALEDVLNFMA